MTNRLVALLICSVQFVRGEISLDESCQMIGSFFAKTYSRCDRETRFCTDFVRTAGSGVFMPEELASSLSIAFELVDCDEALAETAVLLNRGSVLDPDKTAESITELLHNVSRALYGALYREAFEPNDKLVIAMSHLVHETIDLASHDWDDFRAKSATISFDWFLFIMERIMTKAVHSGYSMDTHEPFWSNIYQIMFDLGAFYPQIAGVTRLRQGIIQLPCLLFLPEHRAPYPQEAHVQIGPPDSLGASVETTEAIELLASAAVGRATDFSLEHMDLIGRMFYVPSDTLGASASILHYYLRTRLCPLVGEVLSFLRSLRDLPKHRFSRWALSLLHVCRFSAPVAILGRMSIEIGQYLTDFPENAIIDLVNAKPNDLIRLLIDEPQPWLGELGSDPVGLVFDFREELMQYFSPFVEIEDEVSGARFMSRKEWTDSVEYESIMIAYGRVIGLCIRYGVPLQMLGLHPVVVDLLKSPQAVEKETIRNGLGLGLEEDITIEVLEPIYFVRSGIVDTMGPAVFDIYSYHRFTQFFHRA